MKYKSILTLWKCDFEYFARIVVCYEYAYVFAYASVDVNEECVREYKTNPSSMAEKVFDWVYT